jgi:hypothetical protein
MVGVITFCAVMIFVVMGGGRWLFPAQAEYIPPVFLGFAAACIVWGLGLVGLDPLKRWRHLLPLLTLLFPLIAVGRFIISDGTAWFVAGGAMVLTLAIYGVAMRRSAR